MCKNQVYLISLIALFTLSAAHSGCVHDQVAVTPISVPHEEVDPDTAGHRMLLASVGGIRIAFELVNVQASANVYNYIKYQLMPAAVNYFYSALKVPRLSNLKLSSTYLGMCGISAPQKYVTQGVQADMLLLVEGAFENAGYVAWARACSTLGSTGRPFVGQVHFNLNGLMPSSDIEFTKDLLATMHEMTHALGFSSSMFNTFRNPVKMGTVNIAGYPTQYIDVQPLTQRVRNYFGCQSAPGAYLENQGGSGSAGSHWERRVFGNEYMTASQLDDFRMSEITLALLESTGWYTVNYKMAEPLVWGKGKGCGFLNSYCKGSNGVARFSEFCTYQGAEGCTAGGRSGGYCGADSFSDNCAYVESYSNADCENPATQRTVAAEVHGVGSKCFMGSIYPSGSLGGSRPYCFKHNCINRGNGYTLQILVGSSTVTCNSAGSYSVNGYYGSITCPDPNSFCTGAGKNYCRRGCMGKGNCNNNGQCICNSGWGMYDCSKRTGNNLVSEPEFTYNNIPSKLVDDYIPKDDSPEAGKQNSTNGN